MKIYITSNGFIASHLKRRFKDNITENFEESNIVINTIGILKEEKYTYQHSHIDTVKELLEKIGDKKLIHISALGSELNHPSTYKHTKAAAERLISSSIENYAVIKPSIVLGKGQKLYEDLKRFKNMPIILVPKMKVSPLKIEKLINLIEEIIKNDLRGEFEICGETMEMKDLFREVFETLGKKPVLISVPKTFFLPLLPFLSAFNIMNKEEYLMIEDNVCKDKNG